MLHGSVDTDVRKIDHNHDHFRDLPKSDQVNVANRWLYMADNGMQMSWGWKFVQENRLAGCWDITIRKICVRLCILIGAVKISLYTARLLRIANINGYLKIAMPVGKAVYDSDENDEKRSNVALVADFDHFNENAYWGLNDYTGNENLVSANLMYNHYFTYRSSLIVGTQMYFSYYREGLTNRTPWLTELPEQMKYYNFDRDEGEIGAYAEYTYAFRDRFSVVLGARGDYNRYYNRFFLTPRGHIKWNIFPLTTLRASAGLGYRSTNIITDNIGVLATGRQIEIPDMRTFDRMEKGPYGWR